MWVVFYGALIMLIRGHTGGKQTQVIVAFFWNCKCFLVGWCLHRNISEINVKTEEVNAITMVVNFCFV